MADQPPPPARRPKAPPLALAAILLGLLIAAFFGARAVRSFRELQYIRQQGLDQGSASVAAVRPWMTIRFIAVAYAVPEEYLYSALDIPFDRRNANRSLGDLNRDHQLGHTPEGEPSILGAARDAISAYRANPVATGLRDVRPWMSVRYIANSSGVPEADIFAALGLPAEGNQHKPLGMLADELKYPGGLRALTEAIQAALSEAAP